MKYMYSQLHAELLVICYQGVR